ncbi:hypothetical protein R3P38DRAFT_3171098 [Favolaschia claudopus]|uniref:NADP-dependent oxidoreductase domain-containing protein n=1 Tax=Favolaschia claudopus TaxID=2862362 RepID=A0AAW0DR79_9AGAR
MEKVTGEVGTKSLTGQSAYCSPIIGGRKIEHLTANIEALDITLTPERIAYLESIVPFETGFPAAMIGDGTTPSAVLGMSAHFAFQPVAQPISLAKK